MLDLNELAFTAEELAGARRAALNHFMNARPLDDRDNDAFLILELNRILAEKLARAEQVVAVDHVIGYGPVTWTSMYKPRSGVPTARLVCVEKLEK